MTAEVDLAVAEALSKAWGRMFTEEVDASNFKAAAAHIVRDVAPVIAAQNSTAIREAMLGSDSLIHDLWEKALADDDFLAADAAERLTKVRQLVDDGTLPKPTWTGNRIEFLTRGTRHPNA